MAADLLAHIEENQADKSIFANTCHSISIGPVTATFCINLDPPSVSVELSILGHNIASCVLSSAHPTCTIGGSIAGFKAELKLTLDIPGKKLDYVITVCAPIVGCTTKSGSISF
jgi:hypothetical protein